jgi:PII-like signaling protein
VKVEGSAKQVTVYVNSNDQWSGKPLYSAIIQLCQSQGIAGASVSRCVEGYGAGHQLHTTRLLELSQDLPLRIDIIDVEERIKVLLPALERMVEEGLLVIADVHTIRLLRDPKR